MILLAALASALLQTDPTTSESIGGTEWITAGGLLVGGFVLGSIVSKIVAGQLSKEARPEALQKAARAIGSLVFAVFVIAGLIAGLAIIDPPALDDLKTSLIGYIPKALSAAIVVIGASVASEILSTGLERSLGQLPATTRSRVLGIVKAVIMGFAILIAASQLGVDTTIIQLAAAALFFGVGLAAALLAGLGGRDVAAQLAAGRALQRTIHRDDRVSIDGVSGLVVELHATAVEVASDDATVHLIPNREALDATIELKRANRDTPEVEDD